VDTIEAGKPVATLWTANEVAHYLRVSRSWVYARAEAGELPCLHVGGLLRFEPSVVHSWLYRPRKADGLNTPVPNVDRRR
jgi:excisionase family DNA binding protein